MNYLLAHDLGTSGNKVTLFAETGALIAESTVHYPTRYFNNNWAEQNADEWWASVCQGTRSVLEGIDPCRVAAVSFSGHMMGALCVDKNGAPLRPSIIWSDQRAQQEFVRLEQELGAEALFAITGHRGSGNYSLPKLMWIKNNEPDIYARTFKSLQCKEYIIFKLTGRFCSEPTDGVGTLAMDIARREWSDDILHASGVTREKLPDVLASTDQAGTVSREAAAATGLAEGTPVVMGGGDGVVAAIGAGAVGAGDSFMSFGSSAWVSTVSTGPVFDSKRRNTNWPHIVDGLYLNDGVMQSAGGSYNWARKALGDASDNHNELENLITATPAGANGVLFLPYLLGERCPWWNPDAKGAFLGITMETSKADMLRAVLEGVAHNMAYIVEILRANGLSLRDIVAIGGGMRMAAWRQILADSMDAAIHVPALLEGATSLGAAITGGVGAGVHPDFKSAAEKFISFQYVHRPDPGRARFYREKRRLFVDSYQALAPLFPNFNQ